MNKKRSVKDIKNIWMLTREYDGLAGAGGVKDVSRQLAESLARMGKSVTVVLPCYGFMDPQKLNFAKHDLSFEVDMNYTAEDRRERVLLWYIKLNKVNIYLVDAERYREKLGIYTYTAKEETTNPSHYQGSSHFDYFAMNILLQKAALDMMILLDEKPDIIHCQDGHTAILPALLKEAGAYRHYFRKTGSIVTIHNAGHGHHQEIMDLPFARAICGLQYNVIYNNLLNGKFDPFLVASPFAVLNTVSENYARELRETDDDVLTGWLGHRLMARGVRLEGITNGFNPADFDTTKPKKLGLPAGYDPLKKDLAGKLACKKNLIEKLAKQRITGIRRSGSLDYHPEQPLLTMIGRLTGQKGVDILITALEKLLVADKKFQVLILGSGAKDLEQALIRLARKKENDGRICVLSGYDPALANRIYAAGDFFLVPSRYEPCGLTDYIAQLAGSLPIVHHVGGLVKVEDGVTGFTFTDYSADALTGTMLRGMRVFRKTPEKMLEMQVAAIKRIHEKYTWNKVVHRYLELYVKAMGMSQ
jgi:starch synthase